MELLDNLITRGIDLQKFGFPNYEDVIFAEQTVDEKI